MNTKKVTVRNRIATEPSRFILNPVEEDSSMEESLVGQSCGLAQHNNSPGQSTVIRISSTGGCGGESSPPNPQSSPQKEFMKALFFSPSSVCTSHNPGSMPVQSTYKVGVVNYGRSSPPNKKSYLVMSLYIFL